LRPPPPLGVGLVYIPGLEPLFESPDSGVEVLELEPQALWRYFPQRLHPYGNQSSVLAWLRALPQRKIVHGVGFPVGGSRFPDPRHLPVLGETITAVGAAWSSEHLVFNEARDNGGDTFRTGFFLPPLATPSGVIAAAANIKRIAASLPVPFAVETPANYLRPIAGQMRDGVFTAAVVEQADCGILLDLHNLWANELNGRQPVEAFLNDIPLERVWEIHLAGGFHLNGYWLDAHSGAIPAPVLDWARRLIPRLPHLSAIVFELLPAYLPEFGLAGVRRAVEQMHELWDLRNSRRDATTPCHRSVVHLQGEYEELSPSEWEDTLANLILSGETPGTALGARLAVDPAIPMIRKLTCKFRMSAIVANLRLSLRLLMLSLPREAFDRLVSDYCREIKPERFAALEANHFADYLNALALDIPYLEDVLRYETTAMDVIADGQPRSVPFNVDPSRLLESLARGELPPKLDEKPVRYEAEIVPPEDRTFAGPASLH